MNPALPCRPARTHRPVRRAFTLLELTLVIALLGVLMAIVVTSVVGRSARAKSNLARAGLQSVQESLSAYNLEYSAYPPDIDTLARLRPPIVDAKKLKDPWQSPYIYDGRAINPDQPYMLASAGPDKAIGTEDDISVWEDDSKPTP